jgi:hypothetical protein
MKDDAFIVSAYLNMLYGNTSLADLLYALWCVLDAKDNGFSDDSFYQKLGDCFNIVIQEKQNETESK